MESEVSVIEGPVEPAPPPKGKKVRLACQRCRDRRIKCDGQMPSCSKCAKAGVRCIDVDARRAGISIPRAFLPDAQARLEWLEDVVKTQLPDFDLSAGPQIPDNAGEEIRVHSRHSSTVPVGAQDDSVGPSIGTKRDFAQSANGTYASIPKRARRMTADLGLFSLNPNGVQPQYLGSSSGSFFADLLLDAGPEYTSDPDTEGPEDLLEDSHSAEHSVRALLKSLKDTLPPREECDRMVKGFFSFYHADYPVLHQPSFLGLVEALYASAEAPDDCSLQHHGWPVGVRTFEYNDDLSYTERQQGDIPISLATGIAHLFFVLSIAAELRSRKRRFAMDPKPFASQAIACLQKSVAEVLLSSVQSMILYVLHSFLSAEGARTWIMLHVAMSYAIDMGLQRDQPEPSNFSSTMLQMRRRVFLTIYTLERYISTIQGRPLGFEDHSLDMTMPTVSTGPFINDSALADQAYLPYSITHFKWASIISEFKHRFYRLLPGDGSTASIQEMQQHLHDKLKGWLDEGLASVESLPTVHQARFKTKLKIDYHFATGLLYQPSRSCPRPSPQALGFCFESAKQRIRLFDSLYYQNNSSLSWPRTHGVFLAGATFVYCIWASSEIRTTASPAEVAGDLRLCSSLLALGGEWWPLAQRGKKSFERLADATLQALFSSAPSTLPDVQLAPSLDLASLPRIDSEWLDPEAMLQSFFQTDLQFPELFGPFDTSMFDTPDFYTDAPGCTDGINALLE